jgi:alkaline phosphatase
MNIKLLAIAVSALTLTACFEEQITKSDIPVNSSSAWYTDAESVVEAAESEALTIINQPGKAKNIIVFLGDGMGISTVTAARIFDGQLKGMSGEENSLSFGQFPFIGFLKTYNVDTQTPDSAGTMAAMMTGVKTDAGVVGVDEYVERSECSSLAGNELVSALDVAEIAGLATGLVTTARVTHATPAATYAKSPDRNWEDISDMSSDAIADGCIDIADQLVNFENNLEARYQGLDVDGLEVVMGGGRRHFLPNDASYNSPDAVSDVEGDRTDGRDLTAEWQEQYTSGTYIIDQAGFDAIDPNTVERVFGLFNESHMHYEADRANDIAGEPSLREMTEKAIGVLDNSDKGFFLVVEAARIDQAHHAGNAYNALNDTAELSAAVQMAVDNTDPSETLIIVVADHSHVFTFAGFPKRGNPILGKVVSVGDTEVELAEDDLPYTSVGYINGHGFRDDGDETDADEGARTPIYSGRADLTAIDTEAPGFHQEVLVPLRMESHGGEDVAIFASGPGAHLVAGINEQNIVFHVLDYAGSLVSRADSVVQ